jgi:serine/threonine protein kinase/tetratricopeptide (TPR) repeat protein
MSQQIDDSIEALPDLSQRPNAAAGPPSYTSARSLKRELLEELKSSWEEGKPVRAEELIPRWPGDPSQDPDVASLLFEEFCQRRQHGTEHGKPARMEDLAERFPSQKDSLASLFRQHEVLRSVAGASGSSTVGLALPAVGDELFGFRLRHELGRGAFARVFLAEQESLAGRPVVVKVSAIEGEEPQTLAQLQHTHIVPIYSVHEDTRAGIRAVCMPYFGGASLSHVLQAVANMTQRPTHGRQLVEALIAVGEPGPWCEEGGAQSAERGAQSAGAEALGTPPSALRAPRPALHDKLASLDYVQAVAWVVARLAEGLQHAHDRSVLHCDIKPSNILVGADGQPMLLDFNLAQRLTTDQSQSQATLGGTVAYMAPEHLRALATRDPLLARKVDQRTDVYSLGMVLFEMLTGHRPFEQSASYSPMPALIEAMAVERSRAVPSPRAQRPDIPWGLESITRKCLAPDPAARYQRADQLAEDLHRFLEDLPLRYAPELSWRERGRKWVRRHPRLATAGAVTAVAAVFLLLAAGIVVGVRAQLQAVQDEAEANRRRQNLRVQKAEAEAEAAQEAKAKQRKQEFQAGAVRALCLVNTTTDLHDHMAEGLAVCEKTLGVYGVLDRPDWQAQPGWQRLPAADRKELAEDVRELLLLLARARVHLATAGMLGKGRTGPMVAAALAGAAPAPEPLAVLAAGAAGRGIWAPWADAFHRTRQRALQDALALLDRAEAVRGVAPSPALYADRAFYREQLGDWNGAREVRARAEALPPAGARDHYLLATTYAAKFRYNEAIAELNRALEKNPRHYWSWFQRGCCYQERKDYALAVGDFSACIVLWPEFAWGHFNRGRVLHQIGKSEEAYADYTAALKCDPDLVYAYLNRGLLGLDLSRYQAALADFDAAAARGMDNVVLHGGRGIALEHLGKHAQADAAFRRAWACDPDHVAMLLGYAFAVAERAPAKARGAFMRVLQLQPTNAQALYGRGMLFSNQAPDSEFALYFFSEAIKNEPTFVAAYRARALVWAHRGEGEAARRDIDWCVAVEPSGVTLYAAACVYALSARKAANETEAAWMADRAIAFLREAFALGYGKDKAAKDDDLTAIRRHPEFRRLVN